MAQHDMNIANQDAPTSRLDINNALAALVSMSSGTAAPSTMFANMLWYDTTNHVIKVRNEANSAWITLGTVNQSTNKFEPNQTIATQAEAEAGTENTKLMTALRVSQALAVGGTNRQTFISSGTWTAPAGYSAESEVTVEMWGGGGGGGRRNSTISGGGGGGSYAKASFRLGDLGATVAVTVGTGGAGATSSNGVAGGNSTFGSLLTAFGGGSGTSGVGGGGAGGGGVGANGSAGGAGGSLGGGAGSTASGGGVDGVFPQAGGGGGNGAATVFKGGNSLYGGAGGGGSTGSTSFAGGTSVFGGNGGASASTNAGSGTNGSIPGGGGGGGGANGGTVGGDGGRGEVRVIVKG